MTSNYLIYSWVEAAQHGEGAAKCAQRTKIIKCKKYKIQKIQKLKYTKKYRVDQKMPLIDFLSWLKLREAIL